MRAVLHTTVFLREAVEGSFVQGLCSIGGRQEMNLRYPPRKEGRRQTQQRDVGTGIQRSSKDIGLRGVPKLGAKL